MSSTCSVLPRDLVSVEVAAEQVGAHPQTLLTSAHDSGALTDACTRKGPQMANPRPTPKPENLRPPWPPGTSGNPAGYSRGRRISDAIERLIEEMALDREFGATAIAMALGKKYMLKRKVKDPETGEEIWVEHKPDIAWFNMILERIEPVAKQTDDSAVLEALGDDDDSELPARVDQSKASGSSATVAE